MQNASKLVRMTIRNIGCVGPDGLTVELDNVVCLVGKNNAGKSTVLKAYALAVGAETFSAEKDRCQHSKDDEFSEVELEVHIPKGIGNVDEKWKRPEGELLIVRSLWRWAAPAYKADRWTWDPETAEWSTEGKAGGADNVFKSRLPKPIRIGSLQDAEGMEKTLSTMALAPLLATIELERANAGSQLAGAIASVAEKLAGLGNAHEQRFNEISEKVGQSFQGVFPGLGVRLTVQPTQVVPKVESGLKVKDGDAETAIPQQGTGARRALFWAMVQVHNELTRSEKTRSTYRERLVKQLAEAKAPKGKKAVVDEDAVAALQAQFDAFEAGGAIPEDADDPAFPGYLLLIDEPENALHPMAARAAQKHLYRLAESADWQVMMTTHSPYFVNPFEDHTTIVRLERGGDGKRVSPKTYRSDDITFEGEQKQWLQAMQHIDPSLAEIFFGSYPVLVEGDTEHAAFMAAVLEQEHQLADKVTVVRARGKAILPALISIMEHFKIDFGVVHDCDTPFRKDGCANGMWAQNETIRAAIEKARAVGINARHRVSVPDFERFLGYEEQSKDKPLSAYREVAKNAEFRAKVQALLDGLTTGNDHDPYPTEGIQKEGYMTLLRASIDKWATEAGVETNPRFKGNT
ncbi:ATP-dependent nuclease [Luteibacter sp. UNCMF366Tsu5.1]|uniref:ATP-dependent nuclease n=1 Tax=Luteibacter sp. UNCMF366Tsu5.1 TaxID=1502758 RepID=UPI000908CC7C|nr:AAA family ATPase [Luteibacter sp. UNCMF366Tsu5.1]SFW44595.1 AAA domain-containing protein, putative AbiEii toxin, Type IV TA system [Luteibacter sp. UNCMF366Tsu5.1]